MRTQPTKRRGLRLLQELGTAQAALQQFEVSLRSAVVGMASPTVSPPNHLIVLLGIVQAARIDLDRRLAQLGAVERSAQAMSPPSRTSSREESQSDLSALSLCLEACRACGRHLGAAFHEAQKAADAVSARIVYGPIRDLEKQLWVLDPCQAH